MSNTYINEFDLYFSALFGQNFYTLADVPSANRNPVMENQLTKEKYTARRVLGTTKWKEHYENLILHPPGIANIPWPVDLVYLNDDQVEYFQEDLEEYYNDPLSRPKRERDRAVITENRQTKRYWILLFPYVPDEEYTNVQNIFESEPDLNWKNPKVRNLALDILKIFDALNRRGYIYEDIHLSKLRINRNSDVIFDFSNLIYPLRVHLDRKLKPVMPEKNAYPLEFAEPAFVKGKIALLDFSSQNYSICALLFFLFFGKHCYDGSLMAGYSDLDLQQHYAKFEAYHNNTVFIFDEEDTRNRIFGFAEDEERIELWNQLPEKVRYLFSSTLNQKNALRETGQVINPAPGSWIKAIVEMEGGMNSGTDR